MMHELALFAGAGGGVLGGKLLGWRTVCAVEIEPYCREVLLRRQDEGHLEPFPIWDDVCTFDGRPWRGKVDIITGGFPCQDISSAGKGAGLEGERSGLWFEMARIIGEVRPRFVLVENSPLLRVRGLAVVLKDLALLGYDAQWCRISAENCKAPHRRDRMWLLADSDRDNGGPWREGGLDTSCPREQEPVEQMADPDMSRPERQEGGETGAQRPGGPYTHRVNWWDVEPPVGRVANGVAHRVDRLRALGNGQVPRVAATAWEILNK